MLLWCRTMKWKGWDDCWFTSAAEFRSSFSGGRNRRVLALACSRVGEGE